MPKDETPTPEPIPVTESDQQPAAEPAAPVTTAAPEKSASEAPQPEGEKPEAKKADDEKPTEQQPDQRSKNDPQRRIDRLTRNWRQAEREGSYWKGRAEALAQELAAKGGNGRAADDSATATAKPEPKVEDYDNLRDWSRAHSAWESQQAQPDKKPAAAEPAKPAAEAASTDDTPQIKPSDAQRASLEATREAHDDFDEVIAEVMPNLPVSAIVAAHDYDNAPELLYELGKAGNLERFAKMTDRQVQREVWKFAESRAKPAPASETPKATGKEPAKAAPQTPKPEPAATRAQPVPTTVSGAAPAEVSLETLATEDIGAFIARRDAQDRKAGYR